MRFSVLLVSLTVLCAVALGAPARRPSSPPAPPAAPALPREFRGVWVATKGNIDWPSRPGLPVARQQAELIQLLDGFRTLNLNAVLLQIRPQGDAFYPSQFEPWSEYLSGREGVAPSPLWDPLGFAIQEAHARNLELHAWLNPFRAKAETSRSPMAPDNLARRRPDLAVSYGTQMWLDPGEPEVRAHVLRVVSDLARRYDLDALHVDDYFYPYPVKDANGRDLPFPDEDSWARYGRPAGLSRSDWRRENVNEFIRRAATTVHAEKPWMQFGVSPFGIWRPGHPLSVRGLDAYEVLAADSRRWLVEGWVDYAVPQLYWTIDSREQSFPTLLSWWNGQNPSGRHVYAGLASARIGTDRNAGELLNQVGLTRRANGSEGMVFWNASSLNRNQGGVAQLLRRTGFPLAALPPASPWLSTNAPPLTDFTASPQDRRQFRAAWSVATTNGLRGFALQIRRANTWSLEILPPARREAIVPLAPQLPPPDELRLTPLGRAGATGVPGLWRRP